MRRDYHFSFFGNVRGGVGNRTTHSPPRKVYLSADRYDVRFRPYQSHHAEYPLVSSPSRVYPDIAADYSAFGVAANYGKCGVGPRTKNVFFNRDYCWLDCGNFVSSHSMHYLSMNHKKRQLLFFIIPFILIVNIYFWNYYLPSRAYAREPPFNHSDLNSLE